MRVSRRVAVAVLLAAVLGVSPAWATSIFVDGVILKVNPDGSFVVKGYDHYNHTRYQDKICEIPVKLAGNCVFVLDNRLMRREFVLAPGRQVYAIGSSAGAMLVVALSEPASRVVGEVAAVQGQTLKLKVHIGADAYENPIALEGGALFRDGGKEAAKDAVLAAGKTVRVLPARRQTVLAYSPKAFENMIPPKTPLAASGVVKEPAGATSGWALAVPKGEAVEEVRPEARKMPIVWDASGDVAHKAATTTGIGPGSPAVIITFEKRPGVLNHYLVLQYPDEGRTEGEIKSCDANARSLTLKVLQPGGFKDVTVQLAADADIRLDGKEGALAALTPGTQVSVYAARPQTIVLVPAATTSEKAQH